MDVTPDQRAGPVGVRTHAQKLTELDSCSRKPGDSIRGETGQADRERTGSAQGHRSSVGEDGLPDARSGANWLDVRKQIYLDLRITPCTKIYSRWTEGLRAKRKRLNENRGSRPPPSRWGSREILREEGR